MPKLTIDGKEIEVAPGTNLIEAARALGIEVPHYCYHPGLSIAGQCRLCMVDLDKAPRPTIACNTQAADGMVVWTQTDRVRETRKSIMEFHLVNHPLDCPVCDQAGECWLQIYYMKHGLYEPRMMDDKVHKPKAVPLGPHVMLDAERCILCSRCVRFCDEVTGTGELGIFNRGDQSEIGLFPGRELANTYSGNVVDICPVGALTDRDFRFQVRVWYLDTAKSICPGCARGCNIEVHVNRKRPHHADGRRVARLKPRFNAAVNRWWICDEGRYGFGAVDDPTRLPRPLARAGDAPRPISWDLAIATVAELLTRYAPDEIGIIASPRMANEDLMALRRLIERRGIRHVGFRVPPARPGDQDDFLIRADKNPNTRGAELLGLDGDALAILAAARSRRIKCLWIFHHDLLASAWPEVETRGALAAVETLLWSGSNANPTSALATLVLPAAAWVEREGTFTNFKGRVQRFRAAVPPLGQALPDWELVGRVLQALGGEVRASRAEHWFRDLAATVPAFAGLTYQSIGDGGAMIAETVGTPA
ncbi:MAG: (2Fe-2S)-binding protein [Candidatus Rokubacteria bacterium]|nr:(2Fe-2S)-binding protein [Candidatus Rokubacteria bacterium]